MSTQLASKKDVILFQLEHKASLLKERIYATIILLAVLISVDPGHTSSLHVLLIIIGTTVSLWAASIVATRMSRRIVLKTAEIDEVAIQRRLREHAPLLAAGVFPTLMSLLAFIGIIPLVVAVDISIAYGLLLMVGWSLISARALSANKMQTLVLASVELAIGLAIVFLKLFASH